MKLVYVNENNGNVHDARRGNRIAATACGIRLTVHDDGLLMGDFHERDLLDRLQAAGVFARSLCGHCPNRRPPWQRRKKPCTT